MSGWYWYSDNPNCGRCGHLNGQGFCNMTACPYPMIESSTLVVNPVTNYDRIVSKTPEELAEWIAGGVLNLTGGSLEMATEAWADWLKQEATE